MRSLEVLRNELHEADLSMVVTKHDTPPATFDHEVLDRPPGPRTYHADSRRMRIAVTEEEHQALLSAGARKR